VTYDGGVHEVGDGVWAYLQPDGSWGWSNAGLVAGANGSLLVDTLFDVPLTQRMLDALRDATRAAEDIGTVVNTHANGDHCWGNELLAGAEIVASAACAEEMAELPPDRLVAMKDAAGGGQLGALGEYVARIFGPFDFASVHLTLPTRTFTGSLDVPVGGRTVRLHEVGPAHTRGDVLAEVPDAGVVFTGDILFVGGHPIVWAGPIANWVAACDRLLAMDVGAIVPGHGPVTDHDGVRAVRDYFVELEREARARYESGMSAMDAARDLHASDTRGWGDSERLAINVAAVYRELGADVASDTMTLFSNMAELAGGHR
jgi:glyoxylase-like metal-dependent hydrolase (beta-lactamase superfamily II)